MPYGLLTTSDIGVVEQTLRQAASANNNSIRICEIGVCWGTTSRGLKEFCDQNHIQVAYWGVDSGRDLGRVDIPFPGAMLAIGDSAAVHWQVPNDLDWLFIDGCHCREHVKIDFENFAPKVKVGGYVLFHDVCPDCQGRDPQHPGGPTDPDHHIAVRVAIDDLKLRENPDWEDCGESWSDGWGGIAVFRRR